RHGLRGARSHRRRAREEPAPEDRRRSGRAAVDQDGVRRRLPLRRHGRMRSLRARLLLVTAILLALSLGAAGLLFSRIATRRFERLVELGPEHARDTAVQTLTSGWPRDSVAAARRLEAFSRSTGRAAVQTTARGAGPAFAPGGVPASAARVRADGVELEWRSSGGLVSLVRLRGGLPL